VKLKAAKKNLTRDIPNVSEEATKNLDEIGNYYGKEQKLREGDILIGKITPKGETDPTPGRKIAQSYFW
jgi:DNA-directed RNA polymerase subunit beta